MTDYLHSGANKMNKVEAYKNDNKLLLADKLGHAKVSSLKEQNLLNTIATVQQHSNKISQLEADANKVRGAYVYKGTVETEFDLPLNNNSVGDVYNTSSTGMNYAWNGENWDELGGTAVGGTSSEWEWDPVPIYEETLTNGFSYDPDEGDPYSLPSSLFTPALKAILVYIYGGSLTNSYNHTCAIIFNSNISLPGSVNTSTAATLDIKLPIKQTANAGDTRYSLAVEAIPFHNQYIVMGGRDLAFVRHVYESTPDAPPVTLYFLPPKDSLGITGFSLQSSIPSGAKITVYGPKTNA